MSDDNTNPKKLQLHCDHDLAHRTGFKVVRLDLRTGELFTEPVGAETRTIWKVGEVSKRNHPKKPLEICHYAVHYCVGKPVGCYFFVVLCDPVGLLSTGLNRWIPSLHATKVPDLLGPVIKAPPQHVCNLGDALKRGCDALELGEPLTGSWFELSDPKFPGMGVSTRNGLLHSYPISDEQLAFIDNTDAEFLRRPEESGQWYMPSIDIQQDRSWRWHRDGQPIVVLDPSTDPISRWSHIFRVVHLKFLPARSFSIMLLHQRVYTSPFVGDDPETLRRQLMCRSWSSSIVEMSTNVHEYAASFGKLMSTLSIGSPPDAELNGWLEHMYSAITLPYGSLAPWTSLTILSTFLSLTLSCVLLRLFPLALRDDPALGLENFADIVCKRDWKYEFADARLLRPLVAALDSLSVEEFRSMLDVVLVRKPLVTLRQKIERELGSSEELDRALRREQ